MKHQQVIVDYWKMVTTSFTYLALIATAIVFFRLAYAVFTLPRALKRNQLLVEQKLRECEVRMRERRLEREAQEALEGSADGAQAEITNGQAEEEVTNQDKEAAGPHTAEEEPKKEL